MPAVKNVHLSKYFELRGIKSNMGFFEFLA